MDLTECLFKWLKTFNLEGKNDNLEDLCDGVSIAYVMIQIAPEYFNPSILDKIELECGHSWFLRVSNLRKIYLSIVDYYGEVLERHIPDRIQPDLEAIAKDYDFKQLGNLLQLILGCAINCENKERHIDVMTKLSLEIKQALKVAIDELENFEETSLQPNVVEHIETTNIQESNEVAILKEELTNANISKGKAAQKCIDLETLITKLTDEKQLLKIENEKLSEKISTCLKSGCTNDTNYRFDSIEHENLFQRLNNQINSLQCELTRMEEQREDYRINLDIKEKEYHKVLLQVEQLQSKLNEFKNDRDELDRLKYLNEEIIKYKNINEVQKKKLEEFQELKKQTKILEDRNSTLIKQSCELEEEKKTLAVYRGQLELIKKQRDEIRSKASEEAFRADKSEAELKRLVKKYNEVVQSNQKVQIELDNLKLEVANRNKEGTLNTSSIDIDLTPSIVSPNSNVTHQIGTGLVPLKNDFNNDNNEKIIRLEFENSKLKRELKESNDEKIVLLESQVEDDKMRIERLEGENRTNKQRIIELEGQLKDNTSMIQSATKCNIDDTNDISALKFNLNEIQIENDKLKFLVEKKTNELTEKDERFKKHVNKAKETFDLLETHINNSKISSSLPDTSKVQSDDCYWRNLTNQKDSEIEKLKNEFEKSNTVRDIEERLMTISFHNLGFNLQRKSAEERLYSNNFTPTFLSRQRQASSRKFIIPPRKWFNS